MANQWWGTLFGTAGNASVTASGGLSNSTTVTPQQAQLQNIYGANYTTSSGTTMPNWASLGSTISYQPVWPNPSLPLESAVDLLQQFDDDQTLIAKSRLTFGKYRHKKLHKVDLEYLVGLGRAVGKVRRELSKELRRRRAVERLTNKGG